MKPFSLLILLSIAWSCAPEVVVPDSSTEEESPYKTTNSYVMDGKWIGEGVEIDGTVWAPVNCGYRRGSAPAGALYHWGRPDAITYHSIVKESDSWMNVVNDELIHAINDPCPKGWRVPTDTELAKLYKGKFTPFSKDEASGLYGRSFSGIEGRVSVFLPAAGFYDSSVAEDICVGREGRYWSCSQKDSTVAKFMFFINDDPSEEADPVLTGSAEATKLDAYSVRCVKI